MIRNSRRMNLVEILVMVGLSTGISPCFSQGQSPPQASQSKPSGNKPKITSHDSVTVTANFTPEEVEEGKINDVYQAIYLVEQKGDCETAIQRYKTEVIPLASQSKFNVPKNKFLFLANRGIGDCFLAQHRYEEAEQSFRLIMEHLPVWPGYEDSDYPINFREIATAQMGQEHWQAAEESLKKSVSLFDPQIERALKSEYEFARTEHAGNLRGSKAISLSKLAIVYFREEHPNEALKTVELAYEEATKPYVQPSYLNMVVKVGNSVAQATGDKNAMEKWSQRSANAK
jgi:tetratricopeptide (TPR) repeat protein